LRWTPDGRAIAYIESGTQTTGCRRYTATADPFQKSGGDQSKSRIATGDRLAVARVLETKYIVVMKGLGATEHLVV
jgi:hypothetical protein